MSDVPGPELFERPVDRLVREAMARGEFDDLPGAGRPLPGSWFADTSADWWIHRKMADEGLTGDALLPPAVLVRREKAQIDQTLADVRDEAKARAIIEDLNRRIAEVNLQQTGGHVVVTGRVPVEETLARWRAGRRG